jgi:hypothetical protein
LFETRFGLALLPVGRRRQALESTFNDLLTEDLENRVLDFDSAAAIAAPRLRRHDRKADDPWICGILKSRVLCWRDAAPSRRETYDTLPISKFQ